MSTAVKYPRTPHLPWSPGASSDDVRLADLSGLEGREVVVTEKLDGENTTLYRDRLHARSLDSAHHPSRARLKALHARIAPSIPEGTRICGENLTARHSIAYDALRSVFYAFSVWDGDRARSWDATVAFTRERGLPTPRVRFRGRFDARTIRKLRVARDREEGYVVRVADAFDRSDFGRCVAKWVRPGHVSTDAHWMHQAVVENGLAPEAALWSIRAGGPIDRPVLAELFAGHPDIPIAPDALPEQLPADAPPLGDRRLAAVLALAAARSPGCVRPTLLPALAHHLASLEPDSSAGSRIALARTIADVVGRHAILHRPHPDDARRAGLTALARGVDLPLLHLVATDRAPDPDASERVAWSRLVATDAGLWSEDPFAAYREVFADRPSTEAAFRLHAALDRLVDGRVRSPAEALPATHDEIPRGELTVLVGPSGTGKSTLARRLAKQTRREVVSLDTLRERGVSNPVEAARSRLDALAADAVWDATSLTRTQRDLPLSIARRHRASVRLVSLLTPRSVATERNRARKRGRVPDDAVDKQWRRVRWPYGGEAPVLNWVDGVRDANE